MLYSRNNFFSAFCSDVELVTTFFLHMVSVFTLSSIFASSAYFTEEVEQWIDADYADKKDKFANEPDVWVKRGLIADRRKHIVEVLALGVGLKPEELVEFVLVSEGGKDYESIAVTRVLPSDIYQALKFIGMAPGYPPEIKPVIYWPKGERILVTLHWRESSGKTNTTARSVRAEQLIINITTRQPLPKTGFPFTGSTWEPRKESSNHRVCIADTYGEIITVFNSPKTILDVPYIADQGEQYGKLISNPTFLFKTGQKLSIRLQPEFTDGRTRVVNYLMRVESNGNTIPHSSAELHCILKPNPDTRKSIVEGDLAKILDYLYPAIKSGKEPYLILEFSTSLPVQVVMEFCRFLEPIVSQDMFRIEAKGSQLYYKAFLPEKRWRTPKERPIQPVEVHLHREDTTNLISGKILYHKGVFQNDRDHLTPEHWKFDNLSQFLNHLDSGKPWATNGVFFFVNKNLTYGHLLEYYQHLRNYFPTAYVFSKEN